MSWHPTPPLPPPPPQLNFVSTKPEPTNEGGKTLKFTNSISKKSLAPLSYASVCRGNNDMIDPSSMIEQLSLSSSAYLLQSLCPYAEKEGICEALETGRYCPYIHGDLCDLCEMPALHPTNEKQREQHRTVNRLTRRKLLVLIEEKFDFIIIKECLRKHEADCEEAFATQRSQNKKCGVCLETVWDRDGDKRFGILENCDHIFCLDCIRKWRASSNYEHKVVKAW